MNRVRKILDVPCQACGWHFFFFLIFMLDVCVAVDGTSSTSSNPGIVLEEVLEEAPKWKVLRVSQ